MNNQHILFIGNSHTYLHKMPWILAALVKSSRSNRLLAVDLCTENRAGLKEHWNSRKTRQKLNSKIWDAVSLQDRSGGPVEDPETFRRHAAYFCREIKRMGASPLLFMTWAKQERPWDQETISQIYIESAHCHGATLVPVGLAWEQSRQDRPDLNLFHNDGRHAGPAGAYLAACVFYTVLLEKSPAGLPACFDIHGKTRVDLGENDARYLQHTAFQTVMDMRKAP